jgi:hypothetical protein
MNSMSKHAKNGKSSQQLISRKRMVPSMPPDAKVRPSGENETDITPFRGCPERVRKQLPSVPSTLQSRTLRSKLPDARILPLGGGAS